MECFKIFSSTRVVKTASSAIRRYDSLFFDLDDTPWNTAYNSRQSFLETFVEFDFAQYFSSFDEFYSIYTIENERLWDDYAHGLIEKDALNFRRFAYPLEQVGFSPSEVAKLVPVYSKFFFQLVPTKKKIIPDAIEVLTELKDRGYRLFILSNGFRELQEQKMIYSGLAPFFEKVVLSEDIAVQKPDTRLYHFALSATQSDPSSVAMIGDNFYTDILGAHDAGWDQYYFNPPTSPWAGKHLREDFPFHPTAEVASLKELLTIF